jgi:uncharacterized protein (UPF0333 family)
MNKLLIALAVMVAFTSYPAFAAERRGDDSQKTQEQSAAGVTVKVSLVGKGDAMTVKVALNTHTVNLDGYKFDEIVVLRAGGQEYPAKVKSQDGSGHHRSAVIEFKDPGTKDFEVVVKDIAGVKERVFKF